MAEPNLRRQVANAAALPPTLDVNRIRAIATDMDDIVVFTATELAPCSKCPRGAQGWCAGPDVEAEMNAAWQQKEETKRRLARRTLEQQSSKGREDSWKTSSEGSQGCRAKHLLGFRQQTRNTRSIRRPDWLLQASKDDEFGMEVRP